MICVCVCVYVCQDGKQISGVATAKSKRFKMELRYVLIGMYGNMYVLLNYNIIIILSCSVKQM